MKTDAELLVEIRQELAQAGVELTLQRTQEVVACGFHLSEVLGGRTIQMEFEGLDLGMNFTVPEGSAGGFVNLIFFEPEVEEGEWS